ncbi:MAG TPA: hypothetical protein VIT66_01300 [Lysobacter sp.]
MARQVAKQLYVKRVRFKSRKKGFEAPPLEALLRTIKKNAPNLAQRHWPLPEEGEEFSAGTSCLYIARFGTRQNQDGIYFEVGAYVHGRGEDQVALDLSGQDPDVYTGPIIDAAGKKRAIVHIFRCVALGETLLVENQRGTGGAMALARLLAAMFRTHVDPDFPNIELVDVASQDLRRDIEAGKGVESMMIRMLDGAPDEDDSYAMPLFSLRKRVKGAGKLQVFWEADDDRLDTDDVIAAVDESQEDETALDKVTIKLNNGSVINRLGRYRAKRPIMVTVDSHGVLHHSEIKSGLFEYLNDLRRPVKGWRLINDDGYFLVNKPAVSK